MGWQKFLMKRGVGSPGHIVRRLAKRYRLWKVNKPSMSEPTMTRYLFCERIAAQTLFGGPEQYKYLEAHLTAIDELVAHHPDLFSIVMLSIFIEHPELLRPGAPGAAFEVLQETVEEILDAEVPGWRTQGIWSNPNIACSLCQEKISRPNAARMSAAVDNGEIHFLCDECTPPLQMRAMSALGFFMGHANKGTALSELGRRGEALEAYNRVLAIDPGNSKAWYNKGVTLYGLGRHEEALEAYNRVLAINPGNSKAWIYKGATLQELGRHRGGLSGQRYEVGPQRCHQTPPRSLRP